MTDRPPSKLDRYQEVHRHIAGLIEGETDEIAVLATVACELRQAFPYFDWVGFYRVVAPGVLKVGPYQGTHGCLTIPFSAGVCGRCAREVRTQIVPDVRQLEYHIACSSSTLSEIVVPVLGTDGALRAVLDVDSNTLQAFDGQDAEQLERLCRGLAFLYAPEPRSGTWA